LLELTHPQALSQLSVFRHILRQFVLFHSKKRTVISFSGHCIVNIFAIWTQSLATLKVFWACVNYSRSYYRHTSQRYVTTWVSWTSRLSRQCSHGLCSASLVFWRSTRFISSGIESLDSRLSRFYLYLQLLFLSSEQT
jgi:hypothetical protein